MEVFGNRFRKHKSTTSPNAEFIYGIHWCGEGQPESWLSNEIRPILEGSDYQSLLARITKGNFHVQKLYIFEYQLLEGKCKEELRFSCSACKASGGPLYERKPLVWYSWTLMVLSIWDGQWPQLVWAFHSCENGKYRPIPLQSLSKFNVYISLNSLLLSCQRKKKSCYQPYCN